MPRFELVTDLSPLGDQPAAIRELTEGLEAGRRFQTLLGATGTGKTFTIGHVIRNYGRPTLVMSHNKTLAAQLYGELKQLFPNNAVEYFISYYDYYQPEAYIPATDTYIEKDASINEDIDRLRLRTTSSLIEREDVIVVASVSAIYGLGSPREYRELMVVVEKGQRAPREQILEELVRIQYRRDDIGFEPGKFRVRGDVIEVFPAYEEQAVRIELWGDEVERVAKFDPCAAPRSRRSSGRRSIPPSTSSRPDPRSKPRSRTSRPSSRSAWRSCAPRAACWKRTSWRRAPGSTSR
jgi:excinuclease ABC subunit B